MGWSLARTLARDWRVLGLSRTPPASPAPIEWRVCDLFSLLECERALEGAQHAVYLVHSMLPSARLTQGAFEDMDLICADNFARAAARAGVRQIVYLGGLIPGDAALSPHLKSRLEVEQALGSRGVPVTALRSGIVVGPYGTSYRIFRSLVERVPVIPCPPWSRSLTQPVALEDALALLRYALDHPESGHRSYDIGSPDIMSYRELLERTARIMGLRRVFVNVPMAGAWWCQGWLSAVTGAPKALVAPLLESVLHSMVARDRSLQERAGVPGMGFDEAVRRTLARERRPEADEAPPSARRTSLVRRRRRTDSVRSVQRVPLPAGKTARWAAERYSAWLPRVFRRFLRAEVNASRDVAFRLARPRLTLLELSFAHDRSPTDDRQVFYIVGGALARQTDRATGRPRLEFREVLGGGALLVAIHDYRPTLPWFVYNWTQALLHLWVMKSFSRAMRKLSARRPVPDARAPV